MWFSTLANISAQKSVDFWVYALYTLVWPDNNDDPYLYLQCWHQKLARLGRRRSSRLTSLRSEPEEIHLQAWWSRLEANDPEKKGCYLMWKHFLNIRLMMDMLNKTFMFASLAVLLLTDTPWSKSGIIYWCYVIFNHDALWGVTDSRLFLQLFESKGQTYTLESAGWLLTAAGDMLAPWARAEKAPLPIRRGRKPPRELVWFWRETHTDRWHYFVQLPSLCNRNCMKLPSFLSNDILRFKWVGKKLDINEMHCHKSKHRRKTVREEVTVQQGEDSHISVRATINTQESF